jgi:hypothetical protein
MVRLAPEAPGLLLAEHLDGERAILIFRVANLETAVTEIAHRGQIGGRFEMPYGVGAQLITWPQRLAIYEPLTPSAGAWPVAAISDPQPRRVRAP